MVATARLGECQGGCRKNQECVSVCVKIHRGGLYDKGSGRERRWYDTFGVVGSEMLRERFGVEI